MRVRPSAADDLVDEQPRRSEDLGDLRGERRRLGEHPAWRAGETISPSAITTTSSATWAANSPPTGHAVLVSTHDVEFAAQAADEVVVLAEGEVVSSGPVRRVVAESPAFAPQVTKVLGPPWLRVDEVVAALSERQGEAA